jgi:uncharacterized protein (TIGR03382 family)
MTWRITVDLSRADAQPGERIYVRFGETLLEATPGDMPTTFYISDKDSESVTAPCYSVGRIDAAGRTAEVEVCSVCRHTEEGELGSFEFDALAELEACVPGQAPCEEGEAYERDPVDGECYPTEGGCDPDDLNHPCNGGLVNCGDGLDLDANGNCVPAIGCNPQNVDCAPSNEGESEGCNASGRDTNGTWIWALLALVGLRRRGR